MVYGKGLGGGLPISAVIGPAELMNLQPAFAIMTAAGNPVCAAAGRAVLRTIEEEDLMARAALRGEHLLAGLARLAQRHALIGHVRGRGLTCGRRAGPRPGEQGARKQRDGEGRLPRAPARG